MTRWLESRACSIHESLRKALRRRATSAADTDDIVQEVYWRLLQRESDPDLIRDPLAYLYSVGCQVRKERAADTVEDIVCYDSSIAEKAAESSEERRSAEDPAAVHLRAVEGRDRLARLSRAHRAVFVLREKYGYTYAEIAVRLDMPKSKVKRYLVESNRKLRELALRRPKPGPLLGEPGKG